MKKINVIKNSQIVQVAKFNNDEAMNEWIQMLSDTASWGKPERWVQEHQEDISGALESRETLVSDSTIIEYKLPSEYEIQIIDITVEEQVEKERIEALAFLAATDFYIIREIDAGTPCPVEIKTQRAAARLKA